MENSSYSNVFFRYYSKIVANNSGQFTNYFPVTLLSTPDPTLLKSLIDGLVQDARDRDEEYERTLDQVYESSLVTMTPWLRRTGWIKIFMGKDMKMLSNLALKPTAGEAALSRIWDATGRVVEDCYTGVKDCWD